MDTMDTMDTKKLFSWASTKIAFVPFVSCVLDAVAQRLAERIFDE